MESQGLQTYSSFLHENRKEFVILLLLGALAGAAYYLFSFRETPENIPFEERGVLDLEQITVNDYQLERRSWKLKGKRAVISEKSSRMGICFRQFFCQTYTKYASINQPYYAGG